MYNYVKLTSIYKYNLFMRAINMNSEEKKLKCVWNTVLLCNPIYLSALKIRFIILDLFAQKRSKVHICVGWNEIQNFNCDKKVSH